MAQLSKNPDISTVYAQRWPALWALSAGVLMGTLDVSIVNVALPTIVQEMKTNLSTAQWVIVIYGLVITGFMLSMGRLGDVLGKRKVYCWGLVLFSLGSLASGLSPTIYILIAARALQASGAVMMQALVSAMVTEMFPARERGRALGMIGAVVSIGLTLGPAAGGVLLGLASWHFIFLINVPLGVAALVAVLRLVPELPPSDGNESFDFAGTVTLLAALVCYALGLSLAEKLGLSDIRVLALLAGSAAGAAAFAWAERRSRQPMLTPGLLQDRELSLGLLMGFLMFMLLGGTFLLPFYLQYARGLSPFMVGLLMMASPVAMGLLAPMAGAWSDRWGSGGVRLAGILLVTVGCGAISTLGPQSGPLEFLAKVTPIGLGMGLFQAPNISSVMSRARQGQSGVTSGLVSLTRTLGNTTGLPLMGAVFLAHLAAGQGQLDTTITTASGEGLAAALGQVYR